MPRWVNVIRNGNDPLFPVEIRLTPETGGQVDSLRLTDAEMVELAKALDLLCSDSGLLQVWRKAPKEKW